MDQHLGPPMGVEVSSVTDEQPQQPQQQQPPTQITSIDGFFNRKRGRPPKNRFVEVYKSAQLSPQAIFTSFKLERNESHSTIALDTGEEQLAASRLASQKATDLTPSRNRRRCRFLNAASVDTSRNSGANEQQNGPQELSEQQKVSQTISPAFDIGTAKNLSRCVEGISVVRAAGTFYPENASSSPEVPHNAPNQPEAELVDQPEDLSMRSTAAARSDPPPTSSTSALNLNLLQFKHLIDLYQRQVLLPSFLAAASQPLPRLDMRLMLENAAQQKLMLINAATAAAAAAAASAAVPTEVKAEERPERPPPKRSRSEDIPPGYLKFRFNEDCHFERCGYRNHQSHFHCNRRDCHYSFCDKTRFVQHTARHERMDTLMGDDFQQYRANMQCGMSNCGYATSSNDNSALDSVAPKKSSHFHCRKCDYVCTDSNKVVAHRRLHLRLEYVRSAGFRKINSTEPCESSACTYALRHTHYHCVTCDYSVLSRAQLASHKHRSTTKEPTEGATTQT